MTDWARGYSSEWEVRRVNTATWAAAERVGGVISMSIKRSGKEVVPLLENATMTCDTELDSGWYTVFMVADQSERHAIGTFLFERTSRSVTQARAIHDYVGYSVLKPADETIVTVGSYVEKGTNGVEEAARILRSCISAPVTTEGFFTLSDNVVLSIGMSKLAAAWAILNAGGYVIKIDGYGRVRIVPKDTEPQLVLNPDTSDILMPEMEVDERNVGVPNRYYAVSGALVATATNTDPESPTSYQSRGRWIDACDKAPKRVNGETLQEYAERRLAEESTITASIKYKREYEADVVPFSLVRVDLPALGIFGDYVVESQSLTCGNGISVEETAGRRVALWR